MNCLSHRMMRSWVGLGPRYLPFADIATPDLPLRRLLRLSLFQVSVGMTLVLLVGTLNRVMIVELGVPASLVGIMVALPVVFAPFRALIGYRSDTHRCELGWRRVPFIWNGTLLQFGGFAVMPFAILVLAGHGNAPQYPGWIGPAAAGVAFLLVGAGVHTTQTAGLALATDLTPPESHARVVGLMYVMLLAGMIASALAFGAALANFSPGRLIQVVQGAAVVCVLLNGIAMWKQETRRPPRGAAPRAPDPTFRELWASFCEGDGTRRRLVVVGLGTMAFAMADILLEPFGGQILFLTVATTTKLTALLALGGLLGFGFRLARTELRRRSLPHDPERRPDRPARVRAGDHRSAHGLARPLSAGQLPDRLRRCPVRPRHTDRHHEPRPQASGRPGARRLGAVQATAAGLAMALSGTLRDLVNAVGVAHAPWGLPGAANGYLAVYGLEILLLLVTIVATLPLIRGRPHSIAFLKRSA